jgi:WS/DGAT/MGAT family acyltransferase
MERMTGMDAGFLYMETPNQHMHTMKIAVLDPSTAPEALEFEPLRELAARGIPHIPPFRWRLVEAPIGRPVWIDAPDLDLDYHVRRAAVPSPGGSAELDEVVAYIASTGLERDRPLFQLWFVEGLERGRVAYVMKMHHAIADGVAGVATLAAFLDPVPDPPQMSAPAWSPSPLPSTRELFRDNLRRRRRELDRALSALAGPIATARRLRRSWPAAREIFAEGRAPRTSVNRRIGSDRRLAIIRGSLDVAKTITHTHRGTVNDVLLTVVAAGYADLFRSRGESIEGVVLRAFVPVSLHREQPGEARGNVDAGMLVPLPIGERDEIRRLEKIAADTAERKKKSRPPAGSMFRTVLLQRVFLRLMPRQRFMNAYVADVPGPPIPLYFAGAPLLEIFPIVPLTANISIGVGAVSYARQFNVAVVADRDLCPDLEVFVDGARRSLEVLGRRLVPTAS